MKSKDFVRLQKEWYKKLKQSGFNDLEYIDGDGNVLDWMRGSSKFVSTERDNVHVPSLLYSNTLDYYLNMGEKLENIEFESEEHKYIFSLHVEGLSLRKIAALVSFSHVKVLRIINKYKSCKK